MMQKAMSYNQLYYLGVIPQTDELYHHGILGMKWGVRHDHYPLSASEHTTSEKKSGWKQSLEGHREKKLNKYKQKELKRINNRYDKRINRMKDLSQAQREYAEYKEKKKPNSERSKAKQEHIQDELDSTGKALKALKNKEIEAVMKMSYKDMKAEKRAVRINAGKNIAASLFGFDRGQTKDNVKQARRINGNNKKYSEVEARNKMWNESHDDKNKALNRAERSEKASNTMRTVRNIARGAKIAAGAATTAATINRLVKAGRAADNANYQNLANRGLLLEQERFKNAKYRQIR